MSLTIKDLSGRTALEQAPMAALRGCDGGCFPLPNCRTIVPYPPLGWFPPVGCGWLPPVGCWGIQPQPLIVDPNHPNNV